VVEDFGYVPQKTITKNILTRFPRFVEFLARKDFSPPASKPNYRGPQNSSAPNFPLYPHIPFLLTSPAAFPMKPTLLLSLLTVVASHSLPPRNPEIFLDFDGTIAVTEAFENLPLTAYESLPANSEVPPWPYFQDTYYADYLNVSASLAEPSTIQEELQLQSHAGLYAAEKDSFDRVHASGLFTTVSESALEAAAANVTLRAGFWEFVSAAQARGVRVSVISRNWSVRWIRTVLRASAPDELAEVLYIYCPEILPAGVLAANKRDRPVDVFSGDDKIEIMKCVAAKGKQVVFVGDSNSDLGPILLPPTVVGVVAGLDSGSARTIRRENNLWRADQGWEGYTGVDTGAYVLEDWRELVTLLGWTRKRKVVV